jgi:hypothetical protein
MFKWTKRIVIGLVAAVVAGLLVFGTGFGSYLRTSGKMIQTAVKDAIPVEMEIQRARDLLEDLIPEMRANLRLVAAEEVEVANLQKEIQRQREAVAAESAKTQALRDTLRTHMASHTIAIGGQEYPRAELVDDLARRFEHLKTAEMLLAGKGELLRNRQRSLDAAIQKLEKTRIARIELAAQIEALEGQFRLMQAQSAGSEFHIDDSKLAQTQKVISDLKKRLAVAQRVLAREARFVDLIPVEPVSESALVERVDTYFAKKQDLVTDGAEVAIPVSSPATGTK